MQNDWMIDVLTDLRQYALRNYYINLAEQIDDAIVVAAVELRTSGQTTQSEPSELHGRSA
jgi:hypothetical protein